MTFKEQIELQLSETLRRLSVAMSEHGVELSYIDFINEQLPKITLARDIVRNK